MIWIGPAQGGPIRPGIPGSKPLANTRFQVETKQGVVTEFTTDGEGRFSVSLSPGHYQISVQGEKKALGHYGPFEADVVAGEMKKVEWHCDSGMR